MRFYLTLAFLIAVPVSAAAQPVQPPVVILAPPGSYVTTVTATGTQNDYAPVEFTGQPVVIRANNASALTISGFAYPIEGQEVTVMSIGTGDVFLSHQTGSSAANQLINTATSGPTPLAAGKGWARYTYDGTTAKWRLVGHEQGAYITPTFNASDFSANGAMTWTVDSSDVNSFSYYLSGRQLTFQFYLTLTTVGGTTSGLFYINVPGGFTVAKYNSNAIWATDNGVLVSGRLYMTSLSTPQVGLQKTGGAVWTASTNNTGIGTFVVLEVN